MDTPLSEVDARSVEDLERAVRIVDLAMLTKDSPDWYGPGDDTVEAILNQIYEVTDGSLAGRLRALAQRIVAAQEQVRYDDGNWFGVTLGHFIGLLVDAGQDPVVAFRVIEDGKPDDAGQFARRIEMVLIPDGHVRDEFQTIGVERIHKTLAALMERGVVR